MNQSGEENLHAACKEGNIQLVKTLLDRGAMVNSLDANDCTPLQMACKGGNLDVVKLIISCGGSVSASDCNANSPLHWATMRGHTGVVSELLARGAPVEASDKWGWRCLHWAAEGGRLELVRKLIAAGAVVDAATKTNRIPLHIACFYGHAEIVQCLLSCGANPLALDDDGKAAGSDFNDKVSPEAQAAVKQIIKQAVEAAEGRIAASQVKSLAGSVAALAARLQAMEATTEAQAKELVIARAAVEEGSKARRQLEAVLDRQSKEITALVANRDVQGGGVALEIGRLKALTETGLRRCSAEVAEMRKTFEEALEGDLRTLDDDITQVRVQMKGSGEALQQRLSSVEKQLSEIRDISGGDSKKITARLETMMKQLQSTVGQAEQVGKRVLKLEKQAEEGENRTRRFEAQLQETESARSAARMREVGAMMVQRVEEMRGSLEDEVKRFVQSMGRSESGKDGDLQLVTHMVLATEQRVGELSADVAKLRDAVRAVEMHAGNGGVSMPLSRSSMTSNHGSLFSTMPARTGQSLSEKVDNFLAGSPDISSRDHALPSNLNFRMGSLDGELQNLGERLTSFDDLMSPAPARDMW